LSHHLARFFRRFPQIIVPLYWLYRFFRPKYSVGVVGVLFDAQNRVLLVEHVFHPKHPWGMPGGWTDSGENPEQTIIREYKEEVNLDIRIKQLVSVHNPHKHHLDIAYLCETDDLTISQLSYELLNYQWCSLDTLPTMMQFQHEAIQKAYYLRGQLTDEHTPS
jgi:8-oxo-dGTP diphosphatase